MATEVAEIPQVTARFLDVSRPAILDAAAALPGKVFHAGTTTTNNQVVTSGGRVLCAVGLGERVRDAQRAAYALVDAISWPQMQCRRDIGHRAIEREDA